MHSISSPLKEQVTPYTDRPDSKKQQVAEMFDNIAGKYDFLNHFLSLGIDKWWRKKAIDELVDKQPKEILDVATGTADLALAAMRLKPSRIVGVDISKEMLAVGRKKIEKKGLSNQIELFSGDSENLDFDSNTFDAVTVAYGVRNFENLQKGLDEIGRVLKPGGKLVVLEFSRPHVFPIKQLFNFYFKNILPLLGKLVSKDQRAYTYLPESVQTFPEREEFLNHLSKAGFKNNEWKSLTFGISSIYTGVQ